MNFSKRILSLLITVCLVTAALPTGLSLFAAEEVYPEQYTVYPAPHSVVYNEGGVTLENVNLVMTDNADAPTVGRIASVLSSASIAFEQTDGIVSGESNVVLGIVGDNAAIDAYFAGKNLASTAALSEADGYVLSVSDGDVLVMGKDAISLFYGVVTLEQLLAEGTALRNVLINDYSDTVNRGIIEGFYGIPWSFEGRKAIIETSGQYKMNQYIYAPKDDPYHHGALWREPYPAEDLADLKVLVDTAKENNISFIWAVHVDATFDFTDEDDAANALLPAGGTHSGSGGQWWENDRGRLVPPGQTDVDKYDAEETYKSVLAKFEQLYDIGVRQFGFFADDINFPLARFHAPDLVPFVNRLNEEFVKGKGDIEPLIFCPTYYHRADIVFNGRPYMQEIAKLDESVEIMYTGQHVMSDIQAGNNTYNDFFIDLVGRNPFVWWNYPVTDYVPSLVLLGPTPGLNPNAKGTMTGAVANPMQQPFASQITLFGLADYLWNTADYDRDQNWADSFAALYPEVADSLKIIARHAVSGYNRTAMEDMSAKESDTLRPYLTAFETAVDSGDDSAIRMTGAMLKPEFEAILTAIADFRANCASEGLKEDIQPWVDKLESLCRVGVSIVEGYQSLDAIEPAWNAYAQVTVEMAKWPQITVPQLNDGKVAAEIGSVVLTPFIKDMAARLETAVNNSQTADPLTKTNTVFSNIEGFVPPTVRINEVTNATIYYTTYDSAVTVPPYGYFAVKLDNVYKPSSFTADFDFADTGGWAQAAFRLEYSVNGVEWIDTGAVVRSDGLLYADDLTGVAGRYFRFVNIGDNPVSLTGIAFTIACALGETRIPASATSTAGIYQSNTAARLFDGNYTTPYWTNGNQVAGQEVVATYDEPFALWDFALYEATSDYIRNGSVYISEDGEAWTKVAAIGTNFTPETVDGTEYYVVRGNAGGAVVKYIKIATESTANVWTKLHEFTINETTGEKDGIIPAFSQVLDGTAANLIDGSFSTAFSTTSDEPYLDYHLSENANATTLTVLQNSANISDALVSVRTMTAEGYDWVALGTLEAAYNEFNLSPYDGVTDIRFEWADNGVVPRIHEVYTNTDIDKTNLAATVLNARARTESTNGYAWARLQSAIDCAAAQINDPLATVQSVSAAEEALLFWIYGLDKEFAFLVYGSRGVVLANFTETDREAVVIAARYDGQGLLSGYETVTVTIPAGGRARAEVLPVDNVTTFYAWDAETYAPLCFPVTDATVLY